MKRLVYSALLFAALLSVCPGAVAQTTAVTGTVQDPNGIPYASGTIKFQLVNSAGSPTSGTVTINSQQQCQSGGFGSAPCQVPFQGTVGPVLMSTTGSFAISLQDNTLVTPAGTKWLPTVSMTPGILPPLGVGPVTFSPAPITITGASQSITTQLDAAAPQLTTIAVGGGGQPNATYVTSTDQTGILPTSRQLVAGTNTTINISTPGQIAVNATGGGGSPFPGPDPWYDCTNAAYGCTGSSFNTTGNMTSGMAALTVAAAGDFANGQRVSVFGAGAASAAATPSCTATMVGTTGATTYTYKVVRVDNLSGYSAASSSCTVANGNASLTDTNYVKVTIPLADDEDPGNQFAVYGHSGTIAGYGMALPNYSLTTSESQALFIDAGHTTAFPIYLPASPPGGVGHQVLTTTISSGAGTTSLVLSANAQASVTGATVIHDEAAAIQATVTAAVSGCGGTVLLPKGTYQFAHLALPTLGNCFVTVDVTGYLSPYTPIVLQNEGYSLIGHAGGVLMDFGRFPTARITHNNISPIIHIYGVGGTGGLELINGFSSQYFVGDAILIDHGSTNNTLCRNDFEAWNMGIGAPLHASEGFGLYDDCGGGNEFNGSGWGASIDLTGPASDGPIRWVIFKNNTFIRNHTIKFGPTTDSLGEQDHIVFDSLQCEACTTDLFQVDNTHMTGGAFNISARGAVSLADTIGTIYAANISGSGNNRGVFQISDFLGVTGMFRPGSKSPARALMMNSDGAGGCPTSTVSNILCMNNTGGGGITSNTPIVGGILGEQPVTVTSNITASTAGGAMNCDSTAGDIDIHMPDPATNPGVIWILNKTSNGAHGCVLIPDGGDFDGLSSFTLTLLGDTVTLRSDGTNFKIISTNLYSTKRLYAKAIDASLYGLLVQGTTSQSGDPIQYWDVSTVKLYGLDATGRPRLYNPDNSGNYIKLDGTATGTRTATMPNNTGIVAELNLAQSWTAAQNFTSAGTVQVPNSSSATAASDGAIAMDTGPALMYHIYNNRADSLVASFLPALAPANGDLVTYILAGTNYRLGKTTASAISGLSGMTAGCIPKAATATTITACSAMDDGSTTASTITSTEQIVAPSYTATDASHAGALKLGQGPAAVLLANGITIYAPTSITTGYGWVAPAGENASAGLLHLGAASSHLSAMTISPVVTADIANTAVGSAQMAVVNTRQVCDIPVGDTTGSAITNAQLGPQSRVCYIPAAATIVEMDVNADAGTPNVIVGKNHAGSITNIVSGALATAGSGGIACSNTGGTTGINGATTCSSTLQNTSLAAGDYLELVSGTAGGTAKFFVAHVIYTIN